MRLSKMIQAVDTHVCGEPGRVIVGGVLDVPGSTMFVKMRYLDPSNNLLAGFEYKHDRMDEIFATVEELPEAFNKEMAAQRERLEALRAAKGDYISPFDL